MLAAIGVRSSDRNVIEGLHGAPGTSSISRDSNGRTLSLQQMSSRAIAQLVANPPPKVGVMQQRTAKWMLRPYPLGLRFSGHNMSPLPFWLAGAQNVCLNMSNVDVAIHLHFALFNGSSGFVLKPSEMRGGSKETASTLAFSAQDSAEEAATNDEDRYWPYTRDWLHRTTVVLHSLHNLPKRRELRPRYDGSRGACHSFIPQLSGRAAPPNDLEPASSTFKIELHAIGGFCAVSRVLPLPQQNVQIETEMPGGNSGMNVTMGSEVHCFAAEPHASFLRISVIDDRYQEVAFESAVLGRLRRGYRAFQLRSAMGTRIELAYLFVHIHFAREAHLWMSPRELRMQGHTKRLMEKRALQFVEVAERNQAQLQHMNHRQSKEIARLEQTNTQLFEEVEALKKALGDLDERSRTERASVRVSAESADFVEE